MMNRTKKYFVLIAAILYGTFQSYSQQEVKQFKKLHLNELQMIGSHNSYKPGIEPTLWKIIYARDSTGAKS